MLYREQVRPQRRLVDLQTDFLMSTLRRGLLAASPKAEILANPCMFSALPDVKEVPVLFSDIPDAQFRNPKEIITISLIGGTKS